MRLRLSILILLTVWQTAWCDDRSQCRWRQNNLANALGLYESDHHRFPASLLGLTEMLAKSKISANDLYFCPSSHKHYVYLASKDGKHYEIKCPEPGHPTFKTP